LLRRSPFLIFVGTRDKTAPASARLKRRKEAELVEMWVNRRQPAGFKIDSNLNESGKALASYRGERKMKRA
jgi:hypothetical protein